MRRSRSKKNGKKKRKPEPGSLDALGIYWQAPKPPSRKAKPKPKPPSPSRWQKAAWIERRSGERERTQQARAALALARPPRFE